MIEEVGYAYPGSGRQSSRQAARQSDRWLRESLDLGNIDIPRWGEGGFLETDDYADVDFIHPRGVRCA